MRHGNTGWGTVLAAATAATISPAATAAAATAAAAAVRLVAKDEGHVLVAAVGTTR